MRNGWVIKTPSTYILEVHNVRKTPFIFEIAGDFKNSNLLKLHFWFINESDDFAGLSKKSAETHLKGVEDFFNFVSHYGTNLLTHEGELLEEFLDVYDKYLNASRLGITTRAEKKKSVLRPLRSYKDSFSEYRSTRLWTPEIEKFSRIIVGRERRQTKKTSGAMTLSLTSTGESIKFETEYFKSWVAYTIDRLNELRESIKKLEYVQQLLDELKCSNKNLDFISFAAGKPWKLVNRGVRNDGRPANHAVYIQDYVQRAFKFFEAIINSEDSFLIDCFYHSLHPRLYDNHDIHISNPDLAPLKRSKPLEMNNEEWLGLQKSSLKSVLNFFKVTRYGNKGKYAWVCKNGGYDYTFQWPQCFTLDFLFKPTIEERLGVAWLLGWNQITESSFLNSMSVEDFEPIHGAIDIREAIKKRTGDSDTVRVLNTDIFGSSTLEYTVFSKYRDILKSGYESFPFLFEKDDLENKSLFINKPSKAKTFYTTKNQAVESYGLVGVSRFSSVFYSGEQGQNAKAFFDMLIKYQDFNNPHNRDRPNRFGLMKQRLGLDISHSDYKKLKLESLSPETFRRSAQSHDRRYKVFQKQGEVLKNLNNVIGNEIQANKHAHTSSVEHEYFTNAVSPIAVQDLERFANQVSELMFRLAKEIQDEFMMSAEEKFVEELKKTEVVNDYSRLLKIVGKENISEKYEEEKEDLKQYFDELLTKPNYEAFEVLGGQTIGARDISQGKVIVFETPIVCALMMAQIDTFDMNIEEILNTKVLPHKKNIDTMVTEMLSSRAFLSAVVEFKFSETTKNEAKEILEKYSLPPIPIV
ncbi:MAG: hypothetical protein AB7C96_05500 [Hydrogenovibrio sp.]